MRDMRVCSRDGTNSSYVVMLLRSRGRSSSLIDKHKLNGGIQRAYTLMVRLHDIWGMHSIFSPGFPGLLEAFYVQERLMEYLMPDVYQSFVSSLILCLETALITERPTATEYDILIGVGNQVVYYVVRQYHTVCTATAALGRIVVGWSGCHDHNERWDCLGF
jgi:hypothetical protein